MLLFPPSITSHSHVISPKEAIHRLKEDEERVTTAHRVLSVDIFSDAAIGIYLWEHIFKGRGEQHRRDKLAGPPCECCVSHFSQGKV